MKRRGHTLRSRHAWSTNFLLFLSLNVHCSVHKSPPLVYLLSLVQCGPQSPSLFLSRYTLILSFHTFIRLQTRLLLRISRILHASCMNYLSHSWFDRITNILWRIQIMNLLIKQYPPSPTSWYSLRFGKQRHCPTLSFHPYYVSKLYLIHCAFISHRLHLRHGTV
jgi:hypothetical protein